LVDGEGHRRRSYTEGGREIEPDLDSSARADRRAVANAPSGKSRFDVSIGLALALILVSFPHALEDFHYGALQRFGIGFSLGLVVLSIVYSLMIAGIMMSARGNARGVLLLGLLGAIWCAGALIVHGHDMLFAGPEYRHGAISKLLEFFIVILGASLAVVGGINAVYRRWQR
jgi:hypothetical protein